MTVDSQISAGARVTVELAGHDGTGAEMRDVHAMQIRLTHADDEWRMAAADVGAAAGQPD